MTLNCYPTITPFPQVNQHIVQILEMTHGAFGALAPNDSIPLGRINGLAASPNQLTTMGHLSQMGQFGNLNQLAALQIHACRSIPNPITFNQSRCNPSTTGPCDLIRPTASPGSEVTQPSLNNQLRNAFCSTLKRPRGEKRPIPDEHKDEKYYERRKRNNQAAKKSRDARKIREDQIALRAVILEHENSVLRAQLVTLREEARALRRLLLGRTSPHTTINGHCPGD